MSKYEVTKSDKTKFAIEADELRSNSGELTMYRSVYKLGS